MEKETKQRLIDMRVMKDIKFSIGCEHLWELKNGTKPIHRHKTLKTKHIQQNIKTLSL